MSTTGGIRLTPDHVYRAVTLVLLLAESSAGKSFAAEILGIVTRLENPVLVRAGLESARDNLRSRHPSNPSLRR